MKKKQILLTVLAAAALVSCGITASAEGSRDLNKGPGNRMYLDALNTTTAGINRTPKIKVYAKAGETIYLGSSVTASNDGKDITITTPSGVSTVLDVTDDVGLINNYEKEQAGPNVGDTTNGYTPIAYQVTQTGIYTLEYHSPGKAGTNPTPTAYNNIITGNNQNTSIAAWDASVYSNGEYVTGRVFASYFAFSMGNNDLSYNGNMYVLTKDGYIYNIGLNNFDPYGYIMYSNNRGLVDATSQMSLYKNGFATENTMSTMKGNVIAPNPSNPDTDKTYTHTLFINYPASDLPSSMPITPQPSAKINSFSYNGSTSNISTIGSGGYFNVDFSKPANYRLVIDTNNDGSYDENDVIIADAAAAGVNSIPWNGKDKNGNDLTAGEYSVELYTKGGEYHFPMLDVENNTGGIVSELLNDSRVTGDDKYTVYYDASDYTTANGTPINMAAPTSIDPTEALFGTNSKDGIFKYSNRYGDMKALDYWTYTLGEKDTTTLKIVEGSKNGIVSGKVFFDANQDKAFGAGESGMPNIPVTITCEDGTKIDTTTDASGAYTAQIPIGTYTVTITDPAGYDITTGTLTTDGSASETNSNVSVPDLGFYYVKDVAVDVNVSTDTVKVGDNLTYTITVTNTTDFDATSITSSLILPEKTQYVSDTSNGNYDYQTGKLEVNDLAPGESYTVTITVKAEAEGDYTVSASADCASDSNSENNNASAQYTVINVLTPSVNVPPYIIPTNLNSGYAYIFGYNSEQMAAEYNVKLGECSAMLYRLLKQNNLLGSYTYSSSNTPLYSNFAGRWDRSAAEYMITEGYLTDSDSNMNLESFLPRKLAFKLIALSLGFTDDTSLSYEEYAAILQDAGFVDGDENGDLNLDEPILRCQFCKIYNMIIGRDGWGLTTKDGKEITAETYGFDDLNADTWYYTIMLKATSAYDEEHNVDISLRAKRNNLDDYE